MTNDLTYYRQLPYTRRAVPVRDDPGHPYWLASFDELPGCKADGASLAEAMANLDAAFDDYITAMLKWESPIPEPARKPQGEQAAKPLVPPVVRVADITQLYQALLHARTASSAAPAPASDVESFNAAEMVEVG
ncbi:MAG TPA: type II toxin-antitoxin system HicB family antitoxin [Gemmatimonadales bacterium]|nr:type II toxin-antitoxin system HicB family antitoxin [Gemmatimonadales bacterium]